MITLGWRDGQSRIGRTFPTIEWEYSEVKTLTSVEVDKVSCGLLEQILGGLEVAAGVALIGASVYSAVESFGLDAPEAAAGIAEGVQMIDVGYSDA